MADAQKQLQTLSENHHRIEAGKRYYCLQQKTSLTKELALQSAINSRQALESQKQENLGVQNVSHIRVLADLLHC